MFAERYYPDTFFAATYFPSGGHAVAIPTAAAAAAEAVFVRQFVPSVKTVHEARQAFDRIQAWLRKIEARLEVLEESLTLEVGMMTGGGKPLTGDDGDYLHLSIPGWRSWATKKLIALDQSLAPVFIMDAHDGDHLLAHDGRRLCVSLGAYVRRLDVRLTAGGH